MKITTCVKSMGLGCFLLVLLQFNVSAREVAGIEVAEVVTVEGVDKKLVLNGAGIRSKFFFKIYVGSLYLPAKQDDASAILNASEANRISMHFLYDEVSKEKLVNGWNEGFENNLDELALSTLKEKIGQFNGMFSDLKKGDVVLLDYTPNTGTRITIKGNDKGTIEGVDFNRALLSIWIGKNPVTGSLKDAMLGED